MSGNNGSSFQKTARARLAWRAIGGERLRLGMAEIESQDIPEGLRNEPVELVAFPLAGAERSSALQRAILALVMPTHKRHFARGLQLLGSSTYRRTKLFESDRPA